MRRPDVRVAEVLHRVVDHLLALGRDRAVAGVATDAVAVVGDRLVGLGQVVAVQVAAEAADRGRVEAAGGRAGDEDDGALRQDGLDRAAEARVGAEVHVVGQFGVIVGADAAAGTIGVGVGSGAFAFCK